MKLWFLATRSRRCYDTQVIYMMITGTKRDRKRADAGEHSGMTVWRAEQAKKKVEHQEAEGSIIVTVDAHAAETKSVTKKSLADDRSRTGFAIGDRVNVLGTMDNKLYPATVYNVGESKVELRWDDGDVSNRFHAFDVPKLITTQI